MRDIPALAVAAGAVDMSQGVVHCPPPREFLDILSARFNERHLHVYGSPQGNPAYRAAVAQLASEGGAKISPGMILATNGVTGGLTAALLSHLQAGEAVGLCEPFFPAHDWLVRALHFVPQYVPYREDWSLDAAAVLKMIPQVRALVLVNPANPSGTVLAAEDLTQVYAACREHDVLLIVDEVYRDFVWEGEHASLLELTDDYSHLVVVRSWSKNLALAGWRIGYAVSSSERVRAMTQPPHEALYVGAPGPVQDVVAELLDRHRPIVDEFIRGLLTLYRQNRQTVIEAFRAYGMDPVPKEGAYYMLIRHNRERDIAAMQELLDKGIAVAPGVPFFRPGTKDTGYIRVHFALSESDRRRAAEILFSNNASPQSLI